VLHTAAFAKPREVLMKKTLGLFLRAAAGLVFAGALAIAGTTAASAQATARYTNVVNGFGATITLDTSSCTGGSISPPFSIGSGSSSGLFDGTTSGSSTLCNVRYQSGIYGCQFQISASSSGGLFSSSNAYKGSGGRPICEVLTDGSIAGGWQATFRMR
jgi:hypothetical protein